MTTDTLAWICPRCGTRTPADRPGARCPQDAVVLVPPDIQEKYPGDPFLGRVLAGKYALFSVLGKGGFGAVYKAVQEPVDRVVAVKLIRRDIAHRAGVRDRFYREARVVARISHPGAVTLFDYGEDGGTLYMVFEYVEGVPLSVAIERAGGPMAPERAGLVARHLLDALAEAHAQGAVHRDLKPENIMLVAGRDGSERVKVLDFGIAKVMSDAGDDDTLTGADVVLGTPIYMAPEQAAGTLVDGRTDLYAVGVILHEMLAGAPPFRGSTSFDTLMAHREAPIPPLPGALGVPPALAEVVRQALQKDIEARFEDARSMARAIDLSLGYTPVAPMPVEASFDGAPIPSGVGHTSRELYGQADNSATSAVRHGAVASPPSATAAAAAEGTRSRTTLWLWVGAGLVAAAAAAWMVVGGQPEAPVPPPALPPVAVRVGGAPKPPPVAPREGALDRARRLTGAGDTAGAVAAIMSARADANDRPLFWQLLVSDPVLSPLLTAPALAAAQAADVPEAVADAGAPSPSAPDQPTAPRRRARAPRRAPATVAPRPQVVPATAPRPAARPATAVDVETF